MKAYWPPGTNVKSICHIENGCSRSERTAGDERNEPQTVPQRSEDTEQVS